MSPKKNSFSNIEIIEDTLFTIERGFYIKNDIRKNLKLSKDSIVNNLVYLPEEIAELSPFEEELDNDCLFNCVNIDSFSMAREMMKKRKDPILILNLANPVNPGGGVRNGARAQEEDLCRKSSLLCSLEVESASPYYRYNRSLNTHNGSDAVIITPEVEIIKDENDEYLDESIIVSVMTCAAPMLNTVNNGLNKKEYYDLMHSRIEGMLKVAKINGYKNLVLGAFGCGAFNNDAKVVSDIFWDVFDEIGNQFEEVNFAVLDKSNKHYNFKQFFRNFGDGNFYSEDDSDGKKKERKKDLDDKLKEAVDIYNASYGEMQDIGLRLHFTRERCGDILTFVETVVNSIANHPKSFATDIEEIKFNKKTFKDKVDYSMQELKKAKESAIDSGAGIAAGAAVAGIAPSAAMWVATTFGTASTGTAISTLSGAAATNAALAWLGGGTLASGAGGIAAGQAFLALAGPVGWGIAGASVLTSVVVFVNSKIKAKAEKMKEILEVNSNIEALKETSKKLSVIKQQHDELRDKLHNQLLNCLKYYNCDYLSIEEDGQLLLGAFVNNAKALSALMSKSIDEEGEINE